MLLIVSVSYEIVRIFTEVQCYYSVNNAFQLIFSDKIYCEACY